MNLPYLTIILAPNQKDLLKVACLNIIIIKPAQQVV